MFRNIFLALTLLVFSLAIATAQPTTNPADAPELTAKTPVDFVEHKSSDGSVFIKAPKEWVEKPGMKNVRLNLIGPQVTSVNVVVTPAVSGSDIPMLLDVLPAEMVKQLPGGKLVKAEQIKMNGELALRIVMDSTTPQSINIRIDQIMLLKDGKQYVLTYTALAASYDRFLPIAEEIMVSFHAGVTKSTLSLNDFSFGYPSRWNHIPPEEKGTLALLVLNGNTSKLADGVIRVDSVPKLAPTAREMAAMAIGADGQVLPDPVLVNGVEGVKFLTPSSDLTRPRMGIIVFRGDNAYLIGAGGKHDTDISPALDQIVKSWRWAGAPSSQPAVASKNIAKPSNGLGNADILAATKPLPPADETDRQVKRAIAGWQPTRQNPTNLLTTNLNGDWHAGVIGTIIPSGKNLSTADRYRAPLSFRMICLTRLNDIRIGYAADQIIFNWEMNPDQLRVDGGPANGKHKDGAGRLPPAQWVGIELVVHPNEMIIFVNGVERYRAAGDFSKVNQPFSVTAHKGELLIKSLEVVQ